jgi:glycosyltransferase involved in cell wall biosynthesis
MGGAGAPLRVLHVFGRLHRGGAELRTLELAESFGGQRVRSDFLVLSGLDGALDERVRAAGGEVIKCRLTTSFPVRLLRLLRQRRYDVVHSHVHYFSGVVLAIARLAGTPGRVAHFRTAVVNDRQDTLLRRTQLRVCRRLVDLTATDVLAVGEGAMFEAWGPDWRSDPRCRVVYNGVAPERLRAVQVKKPAAPVIINVASVQPLKNQLRLIGVLRLCLRELPDVTLQVLGREIGEYGSEIRRAARDAGLSDRVSLIGEVDDPMPWIAASSLMILPSLWEGLPGAALEACALGVPVLATDLPGTRELSRHFPGVSLMSLAENDHAWASAAVRIIREESTPVSHPNASLADSPFTLARSREMHYEVWRRVRASA